MVYMYSNYDKTPSKIIEFNTAHVTRQKLAVSIWLQIWIEVASKPQYKYEYATNMNRGFIKASVLMQYDILTPFIFLLLFFSP